MERSALAWMIEPLRKYATFSGRAQRAEYWWFAFAVFALSLVLQIAQAVIMRFSPVAAVGLGLAGAIASLGLLLPQIAVAARRLHDTDRSGWWMLLPFAVLLPIVAALLAGGAALFSGTATGNPFAAAGVTIVLVGGGFLAFAVLGILLLVWYCTAGTQGPNRFGEDPRVDTDFAGVFS